MHVLLSGTCESSILRFVVSVNTGEGPAAPGPSSTSPQSPPDPAAEVDQPARADQPDTAEGIAPTDVQRFWEIVRWICAAGYAIVLTISIIVNGIPVDRIGLTLWILTGLAFYSIGRGWSSFGQVVLDWVPFTFVLIAYDFTRGAVGKYSTYQQGSVNDFGTTLHITEPIEFDKWMFGGRLPTSWLQEHLYVPGMVHWYDAIVVCVYMSHFLVTPIVATVLWIRNRKRFRAWVGCVIALAVSGVATYILYPMAPPWLAAREGFIEPIARISGLGWHYIGLGTAGQVLDAGQALSNPVAAMPSLHTGYAALVAFFFMIGAPWWRKILLACYPLLMGVALVYSGEHYVLDLLAGILYSAVIVLSWRWIRRWRLRRQESKTDTALPEPAGVI